MAQAHLPGGGYFIVRIAFFQSVNRDAHVIYQAIGGAEPGIFRLFPSGLAGTEVIVDVLLLGIAIAVEVDEADPIKNRVVIELFSVQAGVTLNLVVDPAPSASFASMICGSKMLRSWKT